MFEFIGMIEETVSTLRKALPLYPFGHNVSSLLFIRVSAEHSGATVGSRSQPEAPEDDLIEAATPHDA